MTDEKPNIFVTGLLVLLLCYALWWGFIREGGLNKNPVPYPPNITAEQKQIIDNALDVFATNCYGLVRWREDIRLESVSIEKIYSWERDFGWPVFIRLEFVVANPAEHIPNSGRFMSHHLYYEIGGGDMPGITAAKTASQDLCENYTSRERRPKWPMGFKSVPELRFVDALAPLAQ